MSFEFKPFTELLSAIVDNRGKTCPVGDEGIPLIATNCIDRSNLYPAYSTTRFVTEETHKTWFRAHPIPGDILFVCKGSPGRTNLVPDVVDFCIAQDMVAVRADPAKVDPKYLFAALRSSIVQDQIDSLHVGTMIPHFKKGDFSKLKIPMVSREVQESIGDIYFTLSKRIALLRETNATLESIAQALFKSWFVDFDPVHAKQAGRAPEGMDDATAALFPVNLEDSDFGAVPEGWHASTLGSICAENGGAIQTGPFGSQLHASDYRDTGIPVVMPQDLSGRRIQVDKIARVDDADAIRLARHRLQHGDIVFSRRGDVGRHALVGDREVGWLCGTGCLLVRPGQSWPSFTYLSLALDRAVAKEWLLRHAVGATMPNLNTGILSAVPILRPNERVLDAFDNIVRNLDERISHGHANIRTLVELRDTLLPQLISGKLRLPDTFEVMKHAA